MFVVVGRVEFRVADRYMKWREGGFPRLVFWSCVSSVLLHVVLSVCVYQILVLPSFHEVEIPKTSRYLLMSATFVCIRQYC